jgi:single-stranded-DNA-specific exonuclease
MHSEPTLIIRRPAAPAVPGLPGDLHPVLARLYAARHLASAEELQNTLDHLEPPARLKGMEVAIPLLVGMLEQGKHILIVADFDADGATSCALAVRALRLLGAAKVSYVVPNRFEYGYGLTPEIVQVAAQRQPDLIVTVDNGISSVDGVAAARALGIRVLVTDHHLPGSVLPDADAIVNPNQPEDTFPSKHLAGVGVIFYVMLALRAGLRDLGWFAAPHRPEPNLAQLLDLVALGTVADVVPLDHCNRILVAQGLARINQGQCCAGLHALLQVAGRTPGRLVATDLGFMLAPRLNAAGRLEDMSLGIACLLTDDGAAALEMAQRLDGLNRERRSIESDMQAQALAALDALQLGASLPRGLCLFDATWHQGVIGILASRIKDRTHRPVICFAPSSDTDIKGSARSVPGVHIRDALDAVAARHPHLLQKFGGHAMAAGLTLERRHLAAFQGAFAEEVARHLEEDDLRGRVVSDGALEAPDLALELAELLRAAGPWGQGFPPPLFDGQFELVERRIVGEKHLKMILKHPQGKQLEAIAFNQTADHLLPGQRLHAAYRLDVNEYRGQRTLQLIVEHLAAVSP